MFTHSPSKSYHSYVLFIFHMNCILLCTNCSYCSDDSFTFYPFCLQSHLTPPSLTHNEEITRINWTTTKFVTKNISFFCQAYFTRNFIFPLLYFTFLPSLSFLLQPTVNTINQVYLKSRNICYHINKFFLWIFASLFFSSILSRNAATHRTTLCIVNRSKVLLLITSIWIISPQNCP